MLEMIDENWTEFEYIKLQIEVKREEIKQILCYIFTYNMIYWILYMRSIDKESKY